MKFVKRILPFLMCFVIIVMTIFPSFALEVVPSQPGISFTEGGVLGKIIEMIGGTTAFDAIWGTDHSGNYAANKPQAYYTTPTSSVEDSKGNVTNYYRAGDTTTTRIIDSYNQTFNTINNTTNNTSNYSANVKLSDFLNTYTTNNNNYTYSADFKSWYYDNTSNTYNYDASQTYYCTDNSRYYITIDNSTDEYYFVEVQYSPTFVTVNYTYNNIDNSTHYGDVTNVYYFELTDGRNSSTLTASEVAGLDLGYDVVNYELITDDPNTLSLQHFDGDYTDSSSYGRTFYSVNRSTNYVDSGDFGQALQLSSGSAAGVTIPGLSDYDSLSFDFRVYFSSAASLGIYLGDTNLFAQIPSYRKWTGYDYYSDHGTEYTVTSSGYTVGMSYSSSEIGYTGSAGSSTTFMSKMTVPTAYSSSGYTNYASGYYGWFDMAGVPTVYSKKAYNEWYYSGSKTFSLQHYDYYEYRWTPSQYVRANFTYSSYTNKWVSMRIIISGGNLFYFVNGDLVGAGLFTMPSADKFYIKSSGTIYLDELRVTTGDMVSLDVYTPSSAPYDTNKVLALPDELVANTIYVQHSTPINGWRIGGVRPSNPATGFFYIPLYDDYTGGQPQLYDGSNWVNVTAMVYDGTILLDAIGYTFTPMGAASDVDVDLEPGGPAQSGDDDSDTHTHVWEVVETVETTYDEEGNIVTQGYTLYRCSICGEEYKDTDGTGPPSSSSGSDDEEDGGFLSWLGEKLGELFGALGGGIIALLQATLGAVLDGLISLVTMVFEKLTQIVELFGSFGDALGVLWTWLPPEIVTVLVAAVTIFVFVALLKLFMK